MDAESNLSKIETEFQRVLNKALASGITCEQVASLKFFRSLTSSKRNVAYRVVMAVVFLLAACSIYRQVSSAFARGLEGVCYRFVVDHDTASESEGKLSLNPANEYNTDEENYDENQIRYEDDYEEKYQDELEVTDEFCDVCSELRDVHRAVNITPEEFESRFAYSGVPLVIGDGMSDWSAPATFSLDFFRQLYGNSSATLRGEEPGCSFFPYDTGFHSLEEAFQLIPHLDAFTRGSKPWYIGWSNCDDNATSELRRHYNRPYFLPRDSELLNTDWIFMGSPGYGAPLHLDSVGYPSWQAQVKGSKLWLLEPPPECARYCRPLRVVLGQGDIIVLDTNLWYHETLILGDTLSITIGAEYD